MVTALVHFFKTMKPQELKTLLEQGSVTLVDLQDAHEYEHRHIPGAINIPSTTSGQDVQKILTDKDARIVVYGEYDELGKGREALEGLNALGYEQVNRLAGGLMGWMEAGFAVEGGQES